MTSALRLLATIIPFLLIGIASRDTLGASEPTAPGSPELTTIAGTWHEIAKSPLKARSGIGVWTGHELLVSEAGRVAAYDPESDAWRTLDDFPSGRGAPTFDIGVWVNPEWVLFGELEGGTSGYGFDPAADRWRMLPKAPVSGTVIDAIAADDRVVVVSDRWEVAAFETSSDAWETLPSVGVEPLGETESRPGILFWTGTNLLLLTREQPIDPYLGGGASTFWRLEPTSASWVDTGPTPPIDDWPPGLLADDRIWFLGGSDGDAVFDPTTGTWDAFELACGPGTRDAFWTGRLILSAHMALDPATGACYRLPAAHDRDRRDPIEVWTGRELIRWSGGGGEELPAKRDGIAFRLSD